MIAHNHLLSWWNITTFLSRSGVDFVDVLAPSSSLALFSESSRHFFVVLKLFFNTDTLLTGMNLGI